MSIAIKRVYEPAAGEDGRRVLVDRLWPRGISRREARLDEWLKDVAPSPALRTWFDHGAERFERFSELYRRELEEDPLKRAAAARLLGLAKAGQLTLLFGAKSDTINHAAVLQRYLRERLGNS